MTFHHIWFDPGLTTGWAYFEDDRPTRMGELIYPSELFQFLSSKYFPWSNSNLDLVGYENYRIRPEGHERGWTPKWDEVIPIRVIGAIEMAVWNYNSNLEMRTQEPDVKHAGYGYANLGKYDPNKPGMHMQDAIAHGSFYYMENYLAVRKSPNSKKGRIPSYSPTRGIRPRRRT
ncbi:MAG: hypothetical protein ACRD8W_00425 [Nitrososphaeraceae archaeon]